MSDYLSAVSIDVFSRSMHQKSDKQEEKRRERAPRRPLQPGIETTEMELLLQLVRPAAEASLLPTTQVLSCPTTATPRAAQREARSWAASSSASATTQRSWSLRSRSSGPLTSSRRTCPARAIHTSRSCCCRTRNGSLRRKSNGETSIPVGTKR